LGTAYAAVWLAQESRGSAWVYVANIPFYLLAAASLHGISLFTHEGVHGTLSLRPWWNRALSIACAQPVLQNYSAYKVLHLKHHHHLGQEGDPDHYANYTSWTWLEFLMHWGRAHHRLSGVYRGDSDSRYRQGTSAARRWILFEVCLLTLLMAGAILFLPWAVLAAHGC